MVPAISIFEVFKWVLREHGEAQAVQAAALHTMDSDFRAISDVEWIRFSTHGKPHLN